jgi:hypothetical protein
MQRVLDTPMPTQPSNVLLFIVRIRIRRPHAAVKGDPAPTDT